MTPFTAGTSGARFNILSTLLWHRSPDHPQCTRPGDMPGAGDRLLAERA